MKPIKTETCNAVYTLEGCQDLPVTRYINDGNDEVGVESCWELTPEEIKQIQDLRMRFSDGLILGAMYLKTGKYLNLYGMFLI